MLTKENVKWVGPVSIDHGVMNLFVAELHDGTHHYVFYPEYTSMLIERPYSRMDELAIAFAKMWSKTDG